MGGTLGGAQTRLEVAEQAITSFVAADGAKQIGVGLQYFPFTNDACSADAYATPVVPIMPIASAGAAIASALAPISPDGSNAETPALQGVLQYAQSYEAAHPGESVAVVLIDDGDPDSQVCAPNSLLTAQLAAANGLAVGVTTFSIGFVGAPVSPLIDPARAGATYTAAGVGDIVRALEDVVTRTGCQ
jgi:hypothetical protein